MGRAAPVREDKLTLERAEELGRCFKSYKYFIHHYCKMYDSVDRNWVNFDLWREQSQLLDHIHAHKQLVILKARQLGISWITLAYALWEMLFRPMAVVSIFSRRETDAMYLLGEERLRGMYDSLPLWMRNGHIAEVDSGHEWILNNGSAARAFSTNSGDSYVATIAIIDEADLAPDLDKLMRSVKPTIDNGGKMVLLSRSNKEEPESEFKRIYRGAKAGENGWFPVFLPWMANPNRDAAWYAEQRRDVLSRTGALDELYEQYPETDAQALSEKTLDKRIPPLWMELCYEQRKPLRISGSPSLSNLDIYHAPVPGTRYVMGADPAEGNPTSDDSALTIVEVESGREVASFAGKFEPAVFASYIVQISSFYNFAPCMVERNNHGHSVIQWLEEHGRRVRLLLGHDAETHKTDKKTRRKQKRMKAGWLSNRVGKAILYTIVTEHFRENASVDEPEKNRKVLHNFTTYTQLCSIEAASLSAPTGRHDDRADSYSLAQAGRRQLEKRGSSGAVVVHSGKGWGY